MAPHTPYQVTVGGRRYDLDATLAFPPLTEVQLERLEELKQEIFTKLTVAIGDVMKSVWSIDDIKAAVTAVVTPYVPSAQEYILASTFAVSVDEGHITLKVTGPAAVLLGLA